MPVRDGSQFELPKTEAKLRWNFTILAGLDLEATLGLPNQATDLAVLGSSGGALPTLGGSSGLGKLLEVGTVEQIDPAQKRRVTKRVGFNANPLQPFQVVPHGMETTLRLSRIALKKLPEVEASFQFFPSNLLLQQLPFVIELRDEADGDPANFVRHFIFSCWFTDKSARYDVNTKDDTRLIESAVVECGRMLTFDPSVGGSASVQTGSAAAGILFQAIQANEEAKNLLEDLELG